MSDHPPQLGDIPQTSAMNIPTLANTTSSAGYASNHSVFDNTDPSNAPPFPGGPSFSGNSTGNSTGRSTGNSTGRSTGNSADNYSGNSTGRSTGNSAENYSGNSTGRSTGNSTGPTANGDSVENARKTVLNNASSAYNTVQNHPLTQSTKETLTQGPVADHVRDQTAKTGNDLQGLADSRTAPSKPAATGQPLTHYHSFFYNLLSWQHPRATAISFAVTVAFIFTARYFPLLRGLFKIISYVLFATTAAEVAGKLALGKGLATSFRPRRYYTIPREALEASLDDLEQLINFFVIETQRIVFAENIFNTVVALVSAFISYWLIKFVPFWGLSLIATSILYSVPLIYITNQELIDSHIQNAQNIVGAQAEQVKNLAYQNTAAATNSMKQYAGDYSSKAQEYMGSAKQTTQQYAESAKQTTQQYAGAAKDTTQQYAGAAQDNAQHYAGAAQDNAQHYAGAAQDNAQHYAGAAQDNAQHYAGAAKDTTQQYAGAAQDNARQYTDSAKQQTGTTNSSSGVRSADFPTAPKQEPLGSEPRFNGAERTPAF